MAFTKVTGTLVDIGDLDLTNVGQIQLDSIAGDADSNTSITFSGSDVITIATGGTTAQTIAADQSITFGDDISLADDKKAKFGAGNDLQIYHDGSDSYIQQSGVGDLIIQQRNDDKDIVLQSDDGSGGIAQYIRIDGSASLTQFDKDTKHVDSKKATFGDGGDLQLYHDGSNSAIQNQTGELFIYGGTNDIRIRAKNDEESITAAANGAVELYYDNNKVLNTASGAVQISSHGTGGNLNLFSDSGTNEGQFNITYLTDGSSDAHSVAEIRMQQGSGDGSARKGEMLFRVSDNGGPATAMTIANNGIVSTAGNLNVKGSVTHPLSQLVVNNGSGDGGISIYSGSTGTSRLMFADAASGGGQYDGFLAYQHNEQLLGLGVAGTGGYSMAIASSGEVRVGTTNDYSSRFLSYHDVSDHHSIVAENNNGSYTSEVLVASATRNTANATYRLFQCQRRGYSVVMTVNDAGNVQNVNNSFTGISDERLKINIEDASSQWDDIKALRVRNYEWGHGNTGHKQIGLVSQEVEAAGMPHLIEESDADEYQIAYNSQLEGKKVKTMKYSVLYMKAVKALQEALLRIENLEAKVKVLEEG